jgi:DNA replication protein DnaC
MSDEERAARDAERNERLRKQDEEDKLRRRFDNWTQLIRERGSRYYECRLANYEAKTDSQKAVVELLQEYVKNIMDNIRDGVNIVLIGPAGTGKDHLLMAMARAAIVYDRSIDWRNGTSLWVEFRCAIGGDETEAQVVRRLTSPDVLAISDPVPPRGPLTDYQASMLFDVIDSRYSHKRPTWITLNCASRKEAEDRIGAQVIDRLGHGALVLKCNWPSYRKQDM